MKSKKYVNSGEKSFIVIEEQDVEIKEKSTLMFGFAGVGLLGPIIANEMIEQIEDIKEIGYVASDMLPPIATFHHGELMHPFRIYYTRKYNIILGISEVPFQISSAYNDLAKTLCNWSQSEDIKPKEIITFQGIPKKGMIDEFPVYYAAQENSSRRLDQLTIEKVDKGIITGAEATLVNIALTSKLEPIVLFTPVYQIATPEGAASIIEKLNQIYGMNIETQELIEKGKEIKEKMQDLANKARQYRQKQLAGSQQEGPYELYR